MVGRSPAPRIPYRPAIGPVPRSRSARTIASEARTRGRKADTDRESWELRQDDEVEGVAIVRAVGGGVRYEVFEARDLATGERVALKLVRPHRVAEPRSIEALRREGGLGERLRHPNLVRHLRWSDAPPRPYLLMAFVAAPSVEDHLEGVGPVRVAETCLLGIHMLAALGYMHGQGVLHLDVKPANVTMGEPPRLLDLSLARPAMGERLEREVGTPPYMAPEQCRRERLGPQTDVFGLGATLYEALTAMQPFSTGVEDEAAALEDRYPQLAEDAMPLGELREEVPPALARLVMSCLERDPRRRPSDAAAAAAVLRGVLDSLGLARLAPPPA